MVNGPGTVSVTTPTGTQNEVFRITLGVSKFLGTPPLPPGSAGAPHIVTAAAPVTEKYTVVFGAPAAGSPDITLTRLDGAVTGTY
jgi:hypothetical protein